MVARGAGHGLHLAVRADAFAAVHIRQLAVFLHRELLGQEDVVYPLTLAQALGVKAVEGAHVDVAELGNAPCVRQQAALIYELEAVIVLVDIEVAGEHCGQVVLVGAYALHDHLGALGARRHADVVHVQVVVDEPELGMLQAEHAPGTYPDAGRIPSFARAVRRRRKPEVAALDEVEFVSVVEYGGVLTALLAVITPHADVLIARELRLEVLELMVKAFLRAEDVKAVEANELRHIRVALLPAVARFVIALIVHADVIGGKGESLCPEAQRGQQKAEENK